MPESRAKVRRVNVVNVENISIALHKIAVIPLLTHWNYYSLALSHRQIFQVSRQRQHSVLFVRIKHQWILADIVRDLVCHFNDKVRTARTRFISFVCPSKITLGVVVNAVITRAPFRAHTEPLLMANRLMSLSNTNMYMTMNICVSMVEWICPWYI